MLRLFSSLVLVAVLGTPALRAQQIQSPFRFIETKQSLGAFAGYILTDAGQIDLLEAPGAELGPRSAPILGLRYNLRFTGPVSGEAAVGFSPGRRSIYETDALPGDTIQRPLPTGETGVLLLLAEGGVRFHLTGPRSWNNLAPYLLATGGLVADVARRGADEDFVPTTERYRQGPGFAVGAGLGTDYFVNPRTSLRVEIRDQIWRVAAPQGFQVEANNDRTRWKNNLGFSLGVAYHFR
ncbi:MAG: hypothetical protein H0V06_06255 [Gemmatimonadetes bacterium]|nr:hypothetical protein [Gemmatimonadota bacterium]